MATLSELKELMCSVGIDAELVKDLDPAKPLLQQGVDSVDFPAFALALEARYGIKVSDADSLRLKTLDDFLSFIAAA
ncbi:acyl carrier protein [uncultured Thiodictyon sp.]|jgi:acyl carrier protein|uniref:acyl carrier protein n=1 Tax=uncultured Thiodictyon sp. TaxID=1846217 RepID=UPI0025F4ECA2|nr:acyl carrier protein [uncultured Thiodictyon sp.]